MTTRLVLHMCQLIHLIEWGAKKRVVSHAVMSPMCELAFRLCIFIFNYEFSD